MSEFNHQPPPFDPEQFAQLPPLPPGFELQVPESPEVAALREYTAWQKRERQADDKYTPVRVVTEADLTEMAFVAPAPDGMSDQEFRSLPAGQQRRLALEHFYPDGYNLRGMTQTRPGEETRWILEAVVDAPSQFPDFLPDDL